MKFLKLLLILFVTLSAVFVCVYLLLQYINSKPGGIRVVTNPEASVYINDKFVGKTPYKGVFPVDQVSLKLVPESPNQKLLPYETRLNLAPGVQTEVEYKFAETHEDATGVVVSFEKTNSKQAGIVVISMPESAQVWIDGISQGTTPYNLNTITTGLHKVDIKRQGYSEKSLNTKTVKGLRLTVFIKLAKVKEEVLAAATTPTPTPATSNIYVEINKTDTGFVRLRSEPGLGGAQIAELKEGEKYLYLDKDPVSGWYKIRYKEPTAGLPEGMTGWVSNQYSTLTSPAPSASASATVKPAP